MNRDEARDGSDAGDAAAPPPATRRRRIGLRRELLLALAPTVTVLLVLALVEAISRQRLLFASLASSAFLIYMAPDHRVNAARTLILSQLGAALIGVAAFTVLGPGYAAAGGAMVLAIFLMIVFDVVHPPAVSTALSFGLRTGDAGNLSLFCLSLGITVLLLGLQKLSVWLAARDVDHQRREGGEA
jgi:CBS-domain-containing membrane protein